MSNNENYKIKINNWEKYQGRKDVKFPNWFAFSNRFFDDPDFYDFSCEEIVCFVFILSQCSLACKEEISVHFGVFSLRSRIKESVFKNTFLKLEKLGIISILSQDAYGIRTESVRDPSESVRYKTRQDITRQDKAEQGGTAALFDFDFIYKKYPRKEGKTKGNEVFKKQIKSKQDWENIQKAVENYSSSVADREKKYIKQFSTFMNCWRDYIAPPEKINPGHVVTREELLADPELAHMLGIDPHAPRSSK